MLRLNRILHIFSSEATLLANLNEIIFMHQLYNVSYIHYMLELQGKPNALKKEDIFYIFTMSLWHADWLFSVHFCRGNLN